MTNKKIIDAAERASDMFTKTKSCDLPPLAVNYAKHLGQREGMCGDIVLKAFTHYAQVVEGLSCSDELLKADKVARSFFKDALSAKKVSTPTP